MPRPSRRNEDLFAEDLRYGHGQDCEKVAGAKTTAGPNAAGDAATNVAGCDAGHVAAGESDVLVPTASQRAEG